jgi:hypothetical protein
MPAAHSASSNRRLHDTTENDLSSHIATIFASKNPHKCFLFHSVKAADFPSRVVTPPAEPERTLAQQQGCCPWQSRRMGVANAQRGRDRVRHLRDTNAGARSRGLGFRVPGLPAG